MKNKISEILSRKSKLIGRYKTFESMPKWLLFVLFVTSTFIAYYWCTVLSDIAPQYFVIANNYGISFQGYALGFLLCLIAVKAIYFGFIAKRTGGLIYDCYFK